MKHFTKKRILTLLLIVVWLGGCYIIGQLNYKKEAQSQSDSKLPQVVTSKTDPDLLCVVDFKNVEKVDKSVNPWGFTAGKITMPDKTKAYLLMPGTSMTITALSDVTLCVSVHPWEKDICTGANVKIRTGDETKQLRLMPDDSEEYVVENKKAVEISVDSDTDESGDWIVVSIKA